MTSHEEVANSQTAGHKRTYQACIPCRRRKVRCDLGSVDAPHDPPCVRCRREKKQCFFTETRRKRKADDALDGGEDEEHKYSPHGLSEASRSPTHNAPLSGKQSSSYGKRLPDIPQHPSGLDVGKERISPSQEVTNETAAALFQDPISNPRDALHMLVEAAGRTKDSQLRDERGAARLSAQDARHSSSGGRSWRLQDGLQNIDPAIAANTGQRTTARDLATGKALESWSRFRFVRAGWFTAEEAISYVGYFYRHLLPLSPVTLPDYSHADSHPKLLSEEPVLTVTILTIAARYMKVKGPAAQSRSFLIHDKLWLCLQGMITRMFWSQEQFGGGFCGAGNPRRSQNSEKVISSGGLRTLGTIESLLLLSDWHPRSMHFPPGDDSDEIISEPIPSKESVPASPPAADHAKSISAYTNWTEPAVRSDRMCWSLVSFSYSLGCELGVFDSIIPHLSKLAEQRDGTALHQRMKRISRLLYIYVTQTSGRLGYPIIISPEIARAIDDDLRYFDPAGSRFQELATHLSIEEHVERSWVQMATLMKQANEQMFASKQQTHDLIQSKQYLNLLAYFRPLLHSWITTFRTVEVPPNTRAVLLMEYEYARVYLHSPALQAVLEHLAMSASTPAQDLRSRNARPGALLSASTVRYFKENETYINEVVDASRNLLRLATHELNPTGALKHAPVRIHFRLLSGAMFLLKTFALGGKEHHVLESLQLLGEAVESLRTSVVDDVHLSLRIADLVERLSSNIRSKFVRLAVHGNDKTKRSVPAAQSVPKNRNTKQSRSILSNGVTNAHSLNEDNLMFLAQQNPFADLPSQPIDINDNDITIMPPPDYFPNFNQNLYSPTSTSTTSGNSPRLLHHHSQAQQLYTPNNPSGNGNDNFNYDTQDSNSKANNYSQSQSSSDSYDWLTLNVNPLFNYSNNNNNNNGVSTSDQNPNSIDSPEVQGNSMSDDRLQQGFAFNQPGHANAANSAWGLGAFGPDIGDSLEMLGILASDALGRDGGDINASGGGVVY